MFWDFVFNSFKQTNAKEGVGINIGDLTNCNSKYNGQWGFNQLAYVLELYFRIIQAN